MKLKAWQLARWRIVDKDMWVLGRTNHPYERVGIDSVADLRAIRSLCDRALKQRQKRR